MTKEIIENFETDNDLERAFEKLKLIASSLELVGFTIEQKRISKYSLKEWGCLGFPISEDSKMIINIFYDKKYGIRVGITEKNNNEIVHNCNELKRIEIEEKFKENGILDLLINN
ncbi:MAG: hypothetical protein PHH83_01090 [Patescibacteria group bacterium]|nr:hypothetical protein [Patescibacteria group bacterium]